MNALLPSQVDADLLVAVVLVVGIALLWVCLRGVAAVRHRQSRDYTCRWKRQKADDHGSLRAWQCLQCAVVAYSASRGRPKNCRRIAKSGPL